MALASTSLLNRNTPVLIQRIGLVILIAVGTQYFISFRPPRGGLHKALETVICFAGAHRWLALGVVVSVFNDAGVGCRHAKPTTFIGG